MQNTDKGSEAGVDQELLPQTAQLEPICVGSKLDLRHIGEGEQGRANFFIALPLSDVPTKMQLGRIPSPAYL